MGRRMSALVLLIGLVLTGCSTPESAGTGATGTTADQLWAARTSYVGDNSRVIALLDAVGFNDQGSYNVSMQTKKPPYGLTVEFHSVTKPFKDIAFEEDATLVLGLVSNLDHINVTFDGQSYGLAVQAASKKLGYDVKGLGQDKDKLRMYLQSLQD